MSRWRKKQVVIEAWQFMPAGRREELPPWIDPRWFYEDAAPEGDRTAEHPGTPHMLIPTPGGAAMIATRHSFAGWNLPE
jgi:hypothetical protein